MRSTNLIFWVVVIVIIAAILVGVAKVTNTGPFWQLGTPGTPTVLTQPTPQAHETPAQGSQGVAATATPSR
jgi:hypothetical protein